MLNDIKVPLKQGDTLPVTLTFARAGDVAVTFKVLAVGAKGPESTFKMAPVGRGDTKGVMKMDQDQMKM